MFGDQNPPTESIHTIKRNGRTLGRTSAFRTAAAFRTSLPQAVHEPSRAGATDDVTSLEYASDDEFHGPRVSSGRPL
ncbi:hypothetical protein GCM10010350_82790 [Streptomyces galilaeus]|nr:hypothetical protein GCM10010350_82790 [Streptomyces galilaeus]